MSSRFNRRCIAWCILAALIAEAWLVPAALATAARSLETIVICTSTGYKILAVPPGGPGDPSPRDHPDVDCPACLAESVAKNLVTPLHIVVRPDVWQMAAARPIGDALRSPARHGNPPTRAPPTA